MNLPVVLKDLQNIQKDYTSLEFIKYIMLLSGNAFLNIQAIILFVSFSYIFVSFSKHNKFYVLRGSSIEKAIYHLIIVFLLLNVCLNEFYPLSYNIQIKLEKIRMRHFNARPFAGSSNNLFFSNPEDKSFLYIGNLISEQNEKIANHIFKLQESTNSGFIVSTSQRAIYSFPTRTQRYEGVKQFFIDSQFGKIKALKNNTLHIGENIFTVDQNLYCYNRLTLMQLFPILFTLKLKNLYIYKITLYFFSIKLWRYFAPLLLVCILINSASIFKSHLPPIFLVFFCILFALFCEHIAFHSLIPFVPLYLAGPIAGISFFLKQKKV